MKKTKQRGEVFEDTGAEDDFGYKERGQKDWDSQANQSGGNYDSMLKEGVRHFKAKDGENRVRVFPPPTKGTCAAWSDPTSFSFEVFQHSRIGPDNQSYLCPEKAGKGRCPMCEERAWLASTVKSDDKEMKEVLYKLSPIKRRAMIVVDRNNEAAGPTIWVAPYKVDRGFAGAAKDPETRQFTAIDHPDQGRDIFFTRTGSQDRTEYGDYKLSRNTSPISDDKAKRIAWRKWWKANPIPDVLIWYPYEKIAQVFKGKAAAEEEPAEPGTADAFTDEEDDLDGAPSTEKPRKLKKKIKKLKKPREAEESGEDRPIKKKKKHRVEE